MSREWDKIGYGGEITRTCPVPFSTGKWVRTERFASRLSAKRRLFFIYPRMTHGCHVSAWNAVRGMRRSVLEEKRLPENRECWVISGYVVSRWKADFALFPRARALVTGSPCLSPRSFVNEQINEKRQRLVLLLFALVTRPSLQSILENNNFNDCS